MHRIDGAGATSDNRFTGGDPASATAATVVTDDWLNAVQEEIVSVISDPAVTPAIALDKTKTNQLVTAIKRIISASAIAYSQATETVLGVMKVATQAQVDAGVDEETIVTPKKLRFGFKASLAQNGYIVFPSWMRGLIIQWGALSIAQDSSAVATMPIAFPNANFWEGATGTVNRVSSGTTQAGTNVTARTLSSITIANDDAAQVVRWITVGN